MLGGVILALAMLASPGAGAAPPSAPRVTDLDGRAIDAYGLARASATATVFVFVRIDCPVSNRYAPEIRRLAADFSGVGVRFYLVYPNPDATPEQVRRHLAEYGYELPALRDPAGELAAATGVEITPEVAVIVPDGSVVYHGRIDDRWVSFAEIRAAPRRRELAETLSALAAGRAVEARPTRAIGCWIEDLH